MDGSIVGDKLIPTRAVLQKVEGCSEGIHVGSRIHCGPGRTPQLDKGPQLLEVGGTRREDLVTARVL